MRVILMGASGRMGRQMLALFQSAGDIEVIAVDKNVVGDEPECVVARYSNVCDVKESADAIVDFSLHTAACEVVEFALKRSIPLVVATTGHTAYERGYIEKASEQIPVFMASNMSIAIAYIKRFSAKLARIFPDADVEIIEAHHAKKIDSPSGTALSIAKRIVRERGCGKVVVGRGGGREKGDVNVHSLRIGASLGEHEVIIDTAGERIVFRHEVFCRSVYAEGALRALRFILAQSKGLYGIEDILP